MDDLGRRNDGLRRKICRIHILHNALFYALRRAGFWRDGGKRSVFMIGMRVKRRHIDALDFRDLMQEFQLRQPLLFCGAVTFDDLRRAFLPFSDGKEVNKIRQRLRVDRTDAAGKNDIFQSAAVFGQQRDLRQFQHIQDI